MEQKAYIIGEETVRKYLTAEDVAARVQLIRSMGISQICISDWDAANEAFLAGLN